MCGQCGKGMHFKVVPAFDGLSIANRLGDPEVAVTTRGQPDPGLPAGAETYKMKIQPNHDQLAAGAEIQSKTRTTAPSGPSTTTSC